jgi:8-hydroxy-5-deazaflavin:NADPH oxidoreductase
MNIAILGTGIVAKTVTPRLLSAGHSVVLGSRNPRAEGLAEWLAQQTGDVQAASHADAAYSGELVINALPGDITLSALTAIPPAILSGKVLLDLANAVVPSDGGMDLLYPNASLAAAIQQALPETRVVKSMNTMSALVMEDPAALPSPTNIFLCGNDADAKQAVGKLLRDLGWPQQSILDLGGIDAARATEHLFPLLAALFGATGTLRLNFAVIREPSAIHVAAK